MCSISQFFVISPRGDTIIRQEYRGDIARDSAETFFRKVKFWKGDAPPAFNVDGVNFLSVKKNGLYYVGTTKFNVSPSLIIELIGRLTRVFKDYCGVLTEESIRKNFVLIYELLDECMDFGVPQDTSTQLLKTYIHNAPIMVKKSTFNMGIGKKTIPSSAVHKPISFGKQARGGNKKNEIFVDILERLTVLFNASGSVLNSSIEGCIQMKSYLSGNPPLRLALNDDLVVGKRGGSSGVCVLDSCNFHECANLDQFESDKLLQLNPPQGEFVVMNYRVDGEFKPPFSVVPILEETSAFKFELHIKVRANIPSTNYGGHMKITCPVPRGTSTVGTVTPPSHSAEYKEKDKVVVWSIKRFNGGEEHILTIRCTLAKSATHNVKKEFGPISVEFEIPMFNVSNLMVRYLRIADTHAKYKPYRWVRYVTQSDSYVCRI